MHIVNNCHCSHESHTKTKLILRAKNSFDSNCRSKQQSAFIFGLGIAVQNSRDILGIRKIVSFISED